MKKQNKGSTLIKIVPKHKNLYPWQLDALRKIAHAQYTAMVVARQSGKTELLIDILTDFVFTYNKFSYPKALVAGKTSESIYNTFFQRFHQQLQGLPTEVYHKRGTKEGSIHVNVYRPQFGDYAQIVFSGVGNISAIRGGTYDLHLLDEYTLYPKDAWNAVLRASGKIRGAKTIWTATPEGRNNPMYREMQLCKREEALGNPQYAAIHLDAYAAGVMSNEEIELERRAYVSSGEEHLFHQEILARFEAIDAEEAPFNSKIMQLEDGKNDITDIDKKIMQAKVRMNVVCDLGKRGNAATWFWVESPVDQTTGDTRVQRRLQRRQRVVTLLR